MSRYRDPQLQVGTNYSNTGDKSFSHHVQLLAEALVESEDLLHGIFIVINPFSAGTVFICKNVTSVDVIF